MHPRKLAIIGARTSNGKSALALQLARDTAWQNISTLFLSLEMYEEDIIERLFCLCQQVDNFELLRGRYELYKPKWDAFKMELADKPLVITDMLGKTWGEIDEYLTTLTAKPRVIIIDHLQEARGASIWGQKEIIDEYLKKIRLMAIRDNFALVVCSQINRAAQTDAAGSEPQLHHLKSSGFIEESADQIFLLHWPYHYTKKGDSSNFIVNVAKNRNGRTGWIKVRYRPECYTFYETESDYAGENNGQLYESKNWDE